jgi:hypothetical protein
MRSEQVAEFQRIISHQPRENDTAEGVIEGVVPGRETEEGGCGGREKHENGLGCTRGHGRG